MRTSCILLLMVFALTGRAADFGYTQENPLVFSMDIDYPPLEYLDKDGEPKGYDVEFTRRLMKRLNIPVTFSANTWENVAVDILSGKVDLGMMVYSPYRKNQTNYSRSVFRLYYQIVYREGERRPVSLRNVSGMTIAMMDSRPLKDTLTKSGATPIVIKDLKVAMRELSGGKYDALICFSYQTNYLLEHLGIDNLESEDMPLMPREYCYVSNNKELIEAINQELIKMEKEGVVDEVYVNVKTYFRGFKIPMWVWFMLAALVIVSLTVVIIQQRISKRRLQKEIARARKSEELKGIFLSNVSHALRTPLNAIIGFSDLMLDDKEAATMKREEQIHLMELINQNGLQLLHLINELLSLSDIEGKSTLFDRQVTDVDYEMSLYASEIRQQLKDGVTLEVNEPVEGIRALVDPKLLRVVVMHLLDNALKYTEQGKITLNYYVKEGGFYVEVKDTGKGLPEELKQNIFTLLSDKNTYLQDETPGLGLSLCKAIIDRTGGKIGARDNEEDGHGTVVWFWTPTKILD